MYLVLTASSDTYITDKIIDNRYRAEDANVGRAGTIDIFKLYNESTWVSGSAKVTGSVTEISRGLIKFDFDSVRALTASNLDLNSSRFQARLKLFDIMAGQATPSDFYLITYPLSQSFDEGIGRDVASFGDLDVANFITASVSNASPTLWNVSGANAGGLLGDSNLDYISSGTSASPGLTAYVDYGKSQYFIKGNEDLNIDITTYVSSTLAGIIPANGFRISFSGSNETDNKSRFVKRFASRHSSNPFKVPQIHVSWDDSITDNHQDFVFDHSGSLFLRNYVRGTPTNLVSGSGTTDITGNNSLLLKIKVQDFTEVFTGSQHTAGTDSSQVAGLYSASFCMNSFDSRTVNSSNHTFKTLINKSGSITFTTYWISTDESIAYHTGSVTISPTRKTAFKQQPSDLIFRFTNLETEYSKEDSVYISVFVEDFSQEDKVYKIPYSKESISLSKVYYRIREVSTNTIVVPFDSIKESTKLSTGGSGLSFLFKMSSLPKGYVYCFDLLVKDYGETRIYNEASGRFKVS
jgi:hypothetical protein